MCRSTVTDYIYSCSILSAEFMRASIHDAGGSDVVILSQVKARASVPINGKDDDVS
jgi:vacuolar protein sorting-associated protein 54